MAKAKAPVWKQKYGTIEIAAWERETEKYGTQTTFSVSKSYKVNNEWKTQTFYFSNVTEMINMIQVVQAALEFKYNKNNAVNPVDDEDDSPI